MHVPTMFVSCNFKEIGNYVGMFDALCQVAEYGDVVYLNDLGGHYVFLRAVPSIIQIDNNTKYDSIVLANFSDFMASEINAQGSVKELRKREFMELKIEVSLHKFKPRKRIIAFMGQMGSGKSLASKFATDLVQGSSKDMSGNYLCFVNTISFADSLRSCVAKLLTLFDLEKENDYLQKNHEDGRFYYADYLKQNNLKTSRIYGLKKDIEVYLDHPEIDMIDYHLKGRLYESMLALINLVGEEEMPIEDAPVFECSKSQQDIMIGIVRFMIQLSELCKNQEITVRNFLQLFGTNFVRDHIDRNFHTNRVKAEIIREYYRRISTPIYDTYFFLDDARFENETDLIKSMGGLVIGIKRDGENKNSSHPSERTSRESWDTMASITIDNNGSVDDLRRRINETLKDLPNYLGSGVSSQG